MFAKARPRNTLSALLFIPALIAILFGLNVSFGAEVLTTSLPSDKITEKEAFKIGQDGSYVKCNPKTVGPNAQLVNVKRSKALFFKTLPKETENAADLVLDGKTKVYGCVEMETNEQGKARRVAE